jgi:GT2 family glycosyltransferase/glycosyltransferase involved in cell wall biosynthesis
VASVLGSRCRTPFRLIVVNDASPEPELAAWLREAQWQDERVTLLENSENLGFVGAVNRGMRHDDRHDVVLLNSDTEVAHDWLDRLRRAAWSDRRVATVTPFSNDATICSYPRLCEHNPLPANYDTARLDALCARTWPGRVLDVPTGVGFCMYIRRDALRAVGLFDETSFGAGYGEENDFCRRAHAAGWRNLHALDTYVWHTGSVSFGASRNTRVHQAIETMRRLHPDYEGVVHAYVAADPARPFRLGLDLARVRASRRPAVLAVLHNRGGGTLRHVHELAAHLQGRAHFFTLVPTHGGQVELALLGEGEAFRLAFRLPDEMDALVVALESAGIAHVHFHHLLGHDAIIMDLPARLGVSHDFTAHDFYTLCPQLSLTDHHDRYCGERGLAQCAQCLMHLPAPGGLDILAWHARHAPLLQRARYVLAPSRDTARRFVHRFPGAPVRVAPHPDLAPGIALPAPEVRPLEPQSPLKVVVLGALGRIKGADVLEEVAALAARQRAPVEFHLLGYAYRSLRTQPRTRLNVHGAYEEPDLPRLLAELRADVAWFPALCPETYSYTLSACLRAGLPVVAPDLGAFPERLSGRSWSWIRPCDTPAAQWLSFFLQLRDEHFIPGRAPDATRPPLAATSPDTMSAWSYEQDYLTGIMPAASGGQTPDLDFLRAHQIGSTQGVHGAASAIKQRLLSRLVRLRSARGLRNIARTIPMHWQTRVKNWLLS